MPETSKPRTLRSEAQQNAPLTADIALYTVCAELTRHGWRVVPTRGNAKHVDVMGYAHDNPAQLIAVQVKGATRPGMGSGRFWTGVARLPPAESLYVAFVIADEPMEFYIVPSPVVAAVRSKHGDVPLAKVAEYRKRWPVAEPG